MKKLYVVLVAVLLLGQGCVLAQCIINTSNTTPGVTPANPSDTITRGVPYTQTLQLYVPTTFDGFTADSIHISSITGSPSGITYVINPASGTIAGGSNGAICFSGTTIADTGLYPLSFNGTAYYTFLGNHGTIPLSQLDEFSYGFYVVDSVAVPTPPVADFTGDSIVCQNGYAQFTDLSANSPTAWSWTFTGGNPPTSDIADPLVNYPDSGTYTVKLVVSNIGGSDSITKTIYIDAPPAITIDISPDSEAIFDSSGIAIAYASNGMSPYSYAWSTGGSINNILSQLPPGNYFVTVTDNAGCSSTAGTVIDTALPVAAFQFDTISCTNTAVTFTDESLNEPATWSWTFTGGTPPASADTNPTVTYATPGDYPVQLVVSSPGGVDSITQIIHIHGSTATDTTLYLSCGDSVIFGGQAYYYTTMQTDTFTGVYGCDSVITLHLFVTDTIYAADSICAGDSLLFYGTWLDTTGVYTLFRSGNNECDSVLTLNLTVKPAVQVGFTWDSLSAEQDIVSSNLSDTAEWWEFCNPNVFVLTGGSPAGGVYTGGGVSGDTLYAAQFYTPYNLTYVIDTITYTYQCASVSRILILSYCEGIKQINNSALLQLYPNPATDYLGVNYTGLAGINKIEIADVTGRIVMNIEVAAGANKTDIDTHTLNNGLYFINIESGGVIKASSKFVVLR